MKKYKLLYNAYFISFKNNLLPIVLFAIIGAFVFYWSIQLLGNIFSPDTGFVLKGTDAFLGALLAFIFVRLGDFLTKIYEREKKHYNALIYLGTELNSILGILSSNLFILPKFKSTIVDGNVYWGRLNTLPITKSHIHDLYDIEIINLIFTYSNHLETINDDIKNITKGYEDLKSALIDRKIKVGHYIANATLIAENLSLIEAFMKDHADETIRIVSILRLAQIRDKPLGSKILELIIGLNKGPFSETEIKDETKKVNISIESVVAEGSKRISKTLKKHGINKLT